MIDKYPTYLQTLGHHSLLVLPSHSQGCLCGGLWVFGRAELQFAEQVETWHLLYQSVIPNIDV